VELDLEGLGQVTQAKRAIRDFVEEHTLTNGRSIYVLGEGRLVNLAAAEGHPSSVMDMSFANQALCSAYMKANAAKLTKQVYTVPAEIDAEVARLKLAALGVDIDQLTAEQEAYLNTWTMGT
jgi:adenosylhomocysteinase